MTQIEYIWIVFVGMAQSNMYFYDFILVLLTKKCFNKNIIWNQKYSFIFNQVSSNEKYKKIPMKADISEVINCIYEIFCVNVDEYDIYKYWSNIEWHIILG